MPVAAHRFGSEALPVKEQFHHLAIAEGDDLDFLACVIRPVPMRHEVHDGFGFPPRLVIEKIVLGKSAGVHDAEIAADTRPLVRGRFAFVIEAGPHKAARDKRPVRDRCPCAIGHVVGRNHGAFLVVGVFAPRGDRAGRFTCIQRLGGVGLVELVILVVAVIAADHVPNRGQADRIIHAAIHGGADRARAVMLADNISKRGELLGGFRRALLGLFVAHRPEDDARVVAVAQNHVSDLCLDVRGVPELAVLVHHQHSKLIAGV